MLVNTPSEAWVYELSNERDVKCLTTGAMANSGRPFFRELVVATLRTACVRGRESNRDTCPLIEEDSPPRRRYSFSSLS